MPGLQSIPFAGADVFMFITKWQVLNIYGIIIFYVLDLMFHLQVS
jgi:hypothetical protein